MMIYQGDQYALPVQIVLGEEPLTPQDCDDLKIQLGHLCRTYSMGELRYDQDLSCWLFPLTKEQTHSLRVGRQQLQVMVQRGQDQYISKTQTLFVGASLFEEA